MHTHIRATGPRTGLPNMKPECQGRPQTEIAPSKPESPIKPNSANSGRPDVTWLYPSKQATNPRATERSKTHHKHLQFLTLKS